MFLQNAKLRTKFMLSPVLMSIGLAAITIYFFVTINQQFDQLEKATQNDFSRLQSVSRAVENVAYAHNQLNVAAAQVTTGLTPQYFKDFKRQIDQKISECSLQLKLFLKDQKLNSQSFTKATLALKEVDRYQQFAGTLMNSIQTQAGKIDNQLKELNQSFEELSKYTNDLTNRTNVRAKKTIAHYQDQTRSKFEVFAIGLAGFALFSALWSWFLAKNLSQPILNLLNVIHHVTKKGDFNARVPKSSGGEIGTLVDGFNHMLFEIGRTEDIYKSTSDHFKIALEQVGMLMVLTDEKGLIKFCSRSFLELIKKSRAHVINHYIGDFVFEVHDGIVQPQPLDIKNITSKKHQQLKNIWVTDEQKQTYQIRLACTTIDDPSQNYSGALFIGTTVRDRRLHAVNTAQESGVFETSLSDITRQSTIV